MPAQPAVRMRRSRTVNRSRAGISVGQSRAGIGVVVRALRLNLIVVLAHSLCGRLKHTHRCRQIPGMGRIEGATANEVSAPRAKAWIQALVFAGLVAGLSVGCGESAERQEIATQAFPAVHGTDDRQDLYEVTSAPLREQATLAAVALIDEGWTAELQNGSWWTDAPTLQQARNVCEGTLFADQPSIAFCSGVLVDSDIVITAAHCMADEILCKETLLVFDYALDAENTPRGVGSDSIYRCRRVLQRDFQKDIAIVQLDRPVAPPRRPAPFRPPSQGPLEVGDPVTLVGFPSGLPLKVDVEGNVVARSPSVYQTSSDVFAGHSGSMVLDQQRQIVGLQVRGILAFARSSNGCRRNVALPDGAGGESVTRIDSLWDSPIISGGSNLEGECNACATDAECPDNQRCGMVDGTPRCLWDCNGTCSADEACSADLVCRPLARGCIEGDAWTTRCGRARSPSKPAAGWDSSVQRGRAPRPRSATTVRSHRAYWIAPSRRT